MNRAEETLSNWTDREKELQKEVGTLKRMLTRLSESANLSEDREQRFLYAMEGNRDGVWDWNVVTNEVFFSRRWKEMLGFSEDEISNHLSEWDKRIHPDDRDAAYADLEAHMKGESDYYENEHRLKCRDGSYKWILDRGRIISWTDEGEPLRVVGTHSDIDRRKASELKSQELMSELKEALKNVKMLTGLLPICASCKKIRDDNGLWTQIESYIRDHSDADFSHSICPDCAKKLYPEIMKLNAHK